MLLLRGDSADSQSSFFSPFNISLDKTPFSVILEYVNPIY